MPIHCEIVSQDHIVYEGEADMVIVPGAAGEMGIMGNHAPLLSSLKFGLLRVQSHGEEEIFTIAGGIVEVIPGRITVLADAAENIAEIDVERAESARRRAEQLLQDSHDQGGDNVLSIEAALRRSTLRIEAVRRYRSRRAKTSADYSSRDSN